MNKEAALTIKNACKPPALSKFVKEHRAEIDACMSKYIPDLKRPSDQDRVNWIRTLVPSRNCSVGIACHNVCQAKGMTHER